MTMKKKLIVHILLLKKLSYSQREQRALRVSIVLHPRRSFSASQRGCLCWEGWRNEGGRGEFGWSESADAAVSKPNGDHRRW